MNKSTYLLWRFISRAIRLTAFVSAAAASLYGQWNIATLMTIPLALDWFLLDWASGMYIRELEKRIKIEEATWGIDYGRNRK